MWQRLLFCLALAFWLWYWLVQKIFGPFSPDDMFFLHMFWMLKGGARQYLDFYSYHLPAYFTLVTPLLPDGDGLSFAWWLRGLSVVIVACYALMVRPALWPFMLAFVVFGRMTEIRPDTFGLLLFNAAWLLLLKDRRHVLWAAALSGLALLFSARAGILMVGMAPLLIWLARGDPRLIRGLIGLGLVYGLAVLGFALSDPAWFELVVRSVFVDTAGLFPRMPLAQRFLELERITLVAMMLVALAAAGVALRRERGDDRAFIIAAACVMQIGLILADPLPNGYVYGWSMIPTLAGLGLAATMIDGTDRSLAWGGFASAAGMLALALSYPLRNGPAPVESYARLTLGTPMTAGAIATLDTPRLVALTLEPGAPWDQLGVREELCRRIDGTAAVFFWYQPVCVEDAMHNWIGQTWTIADKQRLIATRPPELIVWGEKAAWPAALLGGYSVYPGFALREAGTTARRAPDAVGGQE